jgi:phosphoribosylanthranilate isomerase
MIKICCITNKTDLKIAIDAGAEALGFVSKMPSGPGVISETEIKSLAAYAPGSMLTFLLTSLTDPRAIIAQVLYCRTNAIQLVNYIALNKIPILQQALPKITLMNVIHVNTADDIGLAKKYEPVSDYMLLDSGNLKGQVQTLGGTGMVHNWDISARIVDTIKVPVWLAGGLHAGNVADAIKKVHPFGVDVCSGVRSNGLLDAGKVREFIAQIRN